MQEPRQRAEEMEEPRRREDEMQELRRRAVTGSGKVATEIGGDEGSQRRRDVAEMEGVARWRNVAEKEGARWSEIGF